MPLVPNMRRRLFAGRLTLRALDEDPEFAQFNDWLRTRGRTTYERYMVTHPRLSIEQPLREVPTTLSANGLGLASGGLLVKLGALLLGVTLLAWIQGWLRRESLLPALLLVTAIPNALIVWDGEPTSIARHALQASVLARLGVLLAAIFLLDMYLSRQRNTVRVGSGHERISGALSGWAFERVKAAHNPLWGLSDNCVGYSRSSPRTRESAGRAATAGTRAAPPSPTR